MRLKEIFESTTLNEFKKVMYTGDDYFVMSGMTDFETGYKYWLKGPKFDKRDEKGITKYSTISDARNAAEKKLKGLTDE